MTEHQASKAYNDHNVYVLGAGFGAEAGLPVIKDFMNRMRDAAAWLEGRAGREREQEAISRVLEFRLRAAAAANRVPLNVENIEGLFSLASASGDEELAQAMPLAIAATLDYARQVAKPPPESGWPQIGVVNQPGWTAPPTWKEPLDYVREGMKRGNRKGLWHRCPPYDFYVGVMTGYFNKVGPGRRDTIVTFNYDTLIEDSLDRLGLRFSYGLPYNDTGWGVEVPTWDQAARHSCFIQILKLHGSVNWHLVLEKLLEAGQLKPEHPHKLYQRWDQIIAVRRDYSVMVAANQPPFLVPPSWRKELGSRLAGVWGAAVTALRTATNVIILGYSVPNTDQHFRYLLAAGLQDNISLRKIFFVNPALADEALGAVLKDRLFGPGGLFRPELQEQQIIELLPVDTREFFTGPHDPYAREPYRVRIGRPLNPITCIADDAPFRFSDRPENLGAWQ